jgi:hypothetical protein
MVERNERSKNIVLIADNNSSLRSSKSEFVAGGLHIVVDFAGAGDLNEPLRYQRFVDRINRKIEEEGIGAIVISANGMSTMLANKLQRSFPNLMIVDETNLPVDPKNDLERSRMIVSYLVQILLGEAGIEETQNEETAQEQTVEVSPTLSEAELRNNSVYFEGMLFIDNLPSQIGMGGELKFEERKKVTQALSEPGTVIRVKPTREEVACLVVRQETSAQISSLEEQKGLQVYSFLASIEFCEKTKGKQLPAQLLPKGEKDRLPGTSTLSYARIHFFIDRTARMYAFVEKTPVSPGL